MMSRIGAAFVLIGVLLASGAFAHHSDSEFNQEELVTFRGEVTRLQFVNPHILIHFDVKNSNGEVENWISYGSPTNRMARVGWTSQTLKPGEQVTITGFSSRYGKKTMLFVKLVRANGEIIPLPDTLTGFATRRGLKP